MTDSLTLNTNKTIAIDVASELPSDKQAQIEEQSKVVVKELLGLKVRDLKAQHEKTIAIRDLGASVQIELARKSVLLQQPLAKLVNDAKDGGPVGNALLALQEQTELINPNKLDLSMGTIRRLLSFIPAVGTPLSRWFAKYQSIESVIKEIVTNLDNGKRQLERDNLILKDDQISMRNLIFKLNDYIEFGVALDRSLTLELEREDLDEETKKFLNEEILFSLKQRILDLQQQLAVNQQGILTSEVIIRNNNELIRGVSRSLNVTVTALNIAASLAVALQTQKNILKGVTAINQTTDKLIAETSENLKKQGVEIHKQATEAQLDIENLKTAFSNVSEALSEISKYRSEALPSMTKSIQEMSEVTKLMDESVKRLESSENPQYELLLKI
jgi:uncharacterized protein YaaN involved in tellurite resistance